MASMRDIKRRKTSVQSTGQITKAMKLVSTAKLQKAKVKAEETRPFFRKIYATISSIIKTSGNVKHPLLLEREGNRHTYIVITSNRGLAGGYNGNVCKLIYGKEKKNQDVIIIAAGKKGCDILKKKGYDILSEHHNAVDVPTYVDARDIGEEVLNLYKENKTDKVYIAFTGFNSSISQEAKVMRLLPLEAGNFEEEVAEEPMNYEPEAEAVLDQIIPKYIYSIIYGALKESVASEHGARMTAMDSATNNANDMIDKLALQYNRARQASITQELSEIVGGAEALK
ncbi:MAG: ATP synthase F1 subunit gamma [Firmicutes bacterium HGW-Firmicutes-1]|jgi:F-type H+-transporting ATPase subunit gamma|nr:MAG: ATP synthase F1 subunit gamma [Firmicutes bacterium HGW-Firmicutes-1]